jgi:ADP-heptose:LPS heptosyltransferase
VRPRPSARHPAVFFINGIGDHLLALPALRALAALFPHSLTLICRPTQYRLLFADLSIRALVPATTDFDPSEVAASVGSCDLFISPQPWHSESMTALVNLLRPSRSIGFFPEYQVCVAPTRRHAVDVMFSVATHLEPRLRIDDYAARPALPPTAEESASRILTTLPRASRLLVVHTDTRREKMWRANRFIAVFDAFLEQHSEFLVFIVGANRQRLDQGRQTSRIIPCYGLPLATSLALVGRADLFLGVDSCMLHAADLFRVPSVGLFGPTDEREFGFRFARHVHVCGNGSMRNIGVEQVLEALNVLTADLADRRARARMMRTPCIC